MVTSLNQRVGGGIARCALAILFLWPSLSQSQVGTADVLGTVTDPSGAVVPNVTVTVRNLDTQAIRIAVTNDRGDYVVNLLPRGRYTLKIEAPGFRTFTLAAFTLSTDERARYDAKLETGTVKESVVVTSVAAPLETDSSTVSGTVEERVMQDLPLNDRNFADAIRLQAGITAGFEGSPNSQGSVSSGNSPQDRRPSFAMVANGQNDALNNQLIDGFDNNERELGLVGVRPSIEGIAEIKVDTSTYRAEYGRTAGAVINIVTKSGTNELHGSTFEYFRNDIFDARSPFATIGPKPEYRLNDFGGSLSGPIKKYKTFFFADAEEGRLVQAITWLENVPTAFERQYPGDFSDAGGPNLIACTNAQGVSYPSTVSCALSPVALNYFNLFPLPDIAGTGAGGSVNNFTYSPNKTQYSTVAEGRIDHRFTDNHLLFVRYAYNAVDTDFPGTLPVKDGLVPGSDGNLNPGPSNTTAQNLQLDYVHIFNANLILDLKAASSRVNIDSFPWNYGKNASQVVGMPNVIMPGHPDTNQLTSIEGSGFLWRFVGDSNLVPIFNTDNSFQYGGALTYNRGSENFKFGAALIRRQVNLFQDSFAPGAFLIGGGAPFLDSRANFLTGNAAVEFRGVQLAGAGYRSWEPSWYVQDDWRVTAKLTVNLGLRYDVFTPFTEAHSQFSNFDPATLQFILGGTGGVETDYQDFGPRVGFAYSINPKTVVRGAFGMSYFPADIGFSRGGGTEQPSSVLQDQNPPYFFVYQVSNPPNFTNGPVPLTTPDITGSAWIDNSEVSALTYKAKDLRSSYVEQMNFAAQREFGRNTITLSYAGVLGRALLRTINLDQPGPSGPNQAPLSYLYPQLPHVTQINENYNGASSSYNGMQLIFSRSLSKTLAFQANYAWSHCLGDSIIGGGGSDLGTSLIPDDPRYDYGNCSLDVRHRVAATGIYELPFGRSYSGAKGIFVKGWQANGVFYWQTGLPFTVRSTATNSATRLAFINIPNITVDRPDMIASPHLSNWSLSEGFNINAFTPQTIGTPGSERVNQLFGPHDRRADFSVFKNFAASARYQLQFRAECFNISNTPDYAAPNAVLSGWTTVNGQIVPGVSRPTGPAQGSAFGTINELAGNENPRQFQFALKLLF